MQCNHLNNTRLFSTPIMQSSFTHMAKENPEAWLRTAEEDRIK